MQLLMLGFIQRANDLCFDSENRVPHCGVSSSYEESAKVEKCRNDGYFLESRQVGFLILSRGSSCPSDPLTERHSGDLWREQSSAKQALAAALEDVRRKRTATVSS